MNVISASIIDISVSKENVSYKSDNQTEELIAGFKNNLMYPLYSAQIAAEKAMNALNIPEEKATLVKVSNDQWKLIITVNPNDL